MTTMSNSSRGDAGTDADVVPSPADVRHWRATAYHRFRPDDTVELFSPNHLGIYALRSPLPPERTLGRLSCAVRFLEPVDYDFAGVVLGEPPTKDNLFGPSRRNGTLEATGLGLKAPHPMSPDAPIRIDVVRDAAGDYDLRVDGASVARWSRRVEVVGVFVAEAHALFEQIRVELLDKVDR